MVNALIISCQHFRNTNFKEHLLVASSKYSFKNIFTKNDLRAILRWVSFIIFLYSLSFFFFWVSHVFCSFKYSKLTKIVAIPAIYMKKDVKKFKIVDVPAFKLFFKVLYEVSSWDTWNSYSFLSKFIAANRKNYKSNHVM